MAKKGLFISFEGIEGAGKSTQARLLADYLRDEGHSFVLVHDPGSTAVAEEIRRLLKSAVWAAQRDETTELFLRLAARAHLWNTNIYDALSSGSTVIADRFVDSTLAYQGIAMQWSVEQLWTLSSMASAPPNVTFLMDIDPAIAEERLRGRSGNDWWDQCEKMAELRARYLDIAARFPSRIRVLDGAESIGKIRARVLGILRSSNAVYLPEPEVM